MEKRELLCHTNLVMLPDAIKGRTYKVVSEDENQFIIRNEHDELHYFSKDPKSADYYGLWFCIESTESPSEAAAE